MRRGLFAIVWSCWKAAARSTLALPGPVMLTLLAIGLFGWLTRALPQADAVKLLPGLLWSVLPDDAYDLIAAPLMVLMFRHLLGSRIAARRRDASAIPRIVVLLLLFNLTDLGPPLGKASGSLLASAGLALLLPALGLFVKVRLGLALPAMAVDPDGNKVRQSWRDTRGRFWWLLAGDILAGLPFSLPLLGLRLVRLHGVAIMRPQGLAVITSLTDMAVLLVGTAFTATMFEELGRRGRPEAALNAEAPA